MKICVVGNSTGFKIRPPRAAPDQLTYSEILARAGHEVRNVSKAGATLGEAFGLLDDEVLTKFPDAVILHHGVVEVCYRRTFREWNNRAIPNVYLNGIFRRRYESNDRAFKVGNFFWRALNWATKTAARLAGLKWQWERAERFVETLTRMCELVLKETAATILVVGITPCSPRVEQILPGSAAEIRRTNGLMRQACEKLGARVRFIDADAMFPEVDLPNVAPDGVHFSAAGHRKMGERLLKELSGLGQG